MLDHEMVTSRIPSHSRCETLLTYGRDAYSLTTTPYELLTILQRIMAFVHPKHIRREVDHSTLTVLCRANHQETQVQGRFLHRNQQFCVKPEVISSRHENEMSPVQGT